jgi:hypothetical protein
MFYPEGVLSQLLSVAPGRWVSMSRILAGPEGLPADRKFVNRSDKIMPRIWRLFMASKEQ